MRSKVIKNLYKKEMLDVLRDKKTVLMMLVVPLVLYPLMFILGMQVMSRVSTDMETRTYRVQFEAMNMSLDGDLFTTLARAAKEDGNSLKLCHAKDPEAALLNEEIDVYVTADEIDGKIMYQIHYLSSVTNSSYAGDLIVRLFERYSAGLTVERIEDAGLDTDYILEPIGITAVDQASKEASAGSILGTVLPFMLVVSLLLGTMYPAIDTTAGERERGTLETVLTLPVSNHELIISKFLTVATIGIVSAFLNIVAMCGVGAYMYNMVEKVSEDSTSIHLEKFIPAILVGVLCVFAFAVFISAISMCFSAFAKSYKEANNYLTPLMLLVMFASFVAFLPNVKLTNNMALVPVANICLLIRDLLAFKINMGIIIIVLVSNVIYGMLTIMLLGKIYSSEAILFGNRASGVQIFERRFNMIKGGVPTVSDMWLVLAVVAVAIIYIGGSLTLSNSILGLIVTQLIIAALPILAVWYSKRDFKKTFRLKVCNGWMIAGAILLIFGTIILGILVTDFTSGLFPESSAKATQTISVVGGQSFFVSLLLIAILPAICEELMFRGFVQSALSARMKTVSAIILSAAVFGAFHMSIVKFFTTAMLGLAICYVAQVSGSILPGMLMHAINNSIAVISSFYPVQFARTFPIFITFRFYAFEKAVLFLIGAGLSALGIFVIHMTAKRKKAAK